MKELGVTDINEGAYDIGASTNDLIKIQTPYELPDNFYPSIDITEYISTFNYNIKQMAISSMEEFLIFLHDADVIINTDLHGKHIKPMLKHISNCYVADNRVIMETKEQIDDDKYINIYLYLATIKKQSESEIMHDSGIITI